MFYRSGDEVINLREVTLMRKDFLLQSRKFLVRLFFRNGAGALQFDDAETRDKVFEEIWKKMESLK